MKPSMALMLLGGSVALLLMRNQAKAEPTATGADPRTWGPATRDIYPFKALYDFLPSPASFTPTSPTAQSVFTALQSRGWNKTALAVSDYMYGNTRSGGTDLERFTNIWLTAGAEYSARTPQQIP